MRTQRNAQKMRWGWWGIIGLVALGIVACDATIQSTLPTPLSVTPPPATIGANTPAAPGGLTRTPIATTSAITLTLWTIEEITLGSTPAGRILQSQYDAFRAAYPNIYINVILKKPYGKGGILDFLQTTSAVVPAQLPDFIVIDLAEVPSAATLGILQPLDKLMPADLNDDLFPFAQRAARYRNQWLAVPFATDTQHLVYNSNIVKKPPQTWDDFLRQKSTLLLPLGGDDAFLLQYSAITPLDDTSSLDGASAALTLSFLKRARDAGVLSDATLGLKTVDEVWALYAAGQAPMAQVSASRYLTERAKLPAMRFAPVPTRDGKIASVASGWAFAITTSNPARQAAAAQWIQWITRSDRLAPWLSVTHELPATRSALNPAINSADYVAFIRDQLEHAVFLPRTPGYAKTSDAWRTAITNVWRGQTTPEEAARNIAAPK